MSEILARASQWRERLKDALAAVLLTILYLLVVPLAVILAAWILGKFGHVWIWFMRLLP